MVKTIDAGLPAGRRLARLLPARLLVRRPPRPPPRSLRPVFCGNAGKEVSAQNGVGVLPLQPASATLHSEQGTPFCPKKYGRSRT